MRRTALRQWIGIAVGTVLAGSASAQVIAPGVPADPRVRYDGDMVVRVDVRTPREQLIATGLSKNLWTCGGAGLGQFDIQVSPEQEAALTKAGIKHSVYIPNVQALIDAEWAHLHQNGGPAAGWFDDYKDLAGIKLYIQQLVVTYPDKAKYVLLGKSIENREIFGVRVTGPGDASKRPQMLIEACQHAREWISPMTAMYLADQLLAKYGSDQKITKLLDQVEFIIVPVANPDGYTYTWMTDRLWRKNRHNNAGNCEGVDLNRNWDYHFGGQGSSGNTCDDTYRGTAGFSEAETQVLRDFTIANPRIAASLDLHSYGQLVMTPWGYTPQLPQDYAQMDGISVQIVAAIKAVHSKTYQHGSIYNLLYPASGVQVDWAYGALGFGAWTIELRDTGSFGFILPASQIIPTGEEILGGLMPLADYVSSLQPCFADCDGSGSLDVDDFICFQTLFGLGDAGADCDNSGGLDIDDFICFQTAFGLGCP